MALHDRSQIFADSAEEVIMELIPGYEEASAKKRKGLRQRHAEGVAAVVQKVLIAQAQDAGIITDDPSHQELVRICNVDKSVSLGLENPKKPGDAADWIPPFPLVLVATNYAPHTEYPAIGGNVVWIDPSTADNYLTSLGDSRIFDYWKGQA